MKIEDFERIFPTASIATPSGDIRFHTPNSACVWRVQTLRTKEPDTIAWLDAMPADATLFDVGSNMGQYALYAAVRGLTVHAFEPDSQNFALLCRNLALNSPAGNRVTAWPIALSNVTGLDKFHAGALQYGSSCHNFGTSTNFADQPKQFAFSHGGYATTIDRFCFELHTSPHYIKIDVDGLEPAVLAGAADLLTGANGSRPPASVLVELNSNLPAHMAVIDQMRQHGYTYDEAQAAQSRRTEGPFAGIGNVIFTRKP
jgi:FkbM family methyltransferase